MSATSTLIRPNTDSAPRPVPQPCQIPSPARTVPRPPTAATCSMCNGDRGHWETSDGQTPGKTIQRWVKCTGCNGTGKV